MKNNGDMTCADTVYTADREKIMKWNMEKCAAFVARMILKYGDDVLKELEEGRKEEIHSWEK